MIDQYTRHSKANKKWRRKKRDKVIAELEKMYGSGCCWINDKRHRCGKRIMKGDNKNQIHHLIPVRHKGNRHGTWGNPHVLLFLCKTHHKEADKWLEKEIAKADS